MKTYRRSVVLAATVVVYLLVVPAVEPLYAADALLRQTFDFSAPRTRDVQVFEIETRVITYALDGKRVNTGILRLGLKCTPGQAAGKDADQYTCTRFTLQLGTAPEVAIPAV